MANVPFAIVNNSLGVNFFIVKVVIKMNTDTKRAMKIVALEYNFDAKTLEKLMREYTEAKKADLENYDNAIEIYYPSPRAIAYNFIEWLNYKKQIIVSKRVG